jgi:hypothetical protein
VSNSLRRRATSAALRRLPSSLYLTEMVLQKTAVCDSFLFYKTLRSLDLDIGGDQAKALKHARIMSIFRGQHEDFVVPDTVFRSEYGFIFFCSILAFSSRVPRANFWHGGK